MTSAREEVVDIEVRRSEGVRIEYADGEVVDLPAGPLRAACPCAGCRGARERGGTVWPPAERPSGPSSAAISIVDAQLAGAWGLSIRWSDGHDTGIYAWSMLRRWWDAGLDSPLVADPR